MITKLANFSEISKALSVKNELGEELISLFGRFGLGRILCKLSLEKQEGVSAMQLILALCLIRICGETIHSVYRKDFYDLLQTGKNCYYRMMTRPKMDWRRLMAYFCIRFICILRKEHAETDGKNSALIIDDTTIEKSGFRIERIGRVFDHVVGKYVLGFKILLCAFTDGVSTIPFDFSIHAEKGKSGDYGLTKKQKCRRFSKKRQKEFPDYARIQECDMSKLAVSIEMINRAWKCGLRFRYVLSDSWFTCEELLEKVRAVGQGAVHFVGLAKMGNTKYMVHGRKHSAAELIALYERENSHDCRKYRCRYVTLNGSLGNQSVRIFLIRYGRNERWNIMLTTDVTMSFVRAFELYQLRWNIEVINKETKEYLGLGSYQGRDFNGQIADATLCYLTYTVMVLKKRFSDYETMGELFADMKEDLLALTLWRRILGCLERLLNVLAERIGMTAEELMSEIITDRNAAADYELMAQALERRAG